MKLGTAPGSTDQRTFVMTVFQNVLVLAVGQDMGTVTERSADDDGLSALSGSQSQAFNTVTLALSPSQVQDLVLAQDIGDVSLSLRSFREGEQPVDLERSVPSSVFGVDDSAIMPRRVPSWQEIRGSSSR